MRHGHAALDLEFLRRSGPSSNGSAAQANSARDALIPRICILSTES